jgi:hypothetical protein
VYAAVARSKDPFQIPKAGLEIAPVAGLASINVNGSVGAEPAKAQCMMSAWMGRGSCYDWRHMFS